MKYNPKIVTEYFISCGLPLPELEYRFHPERKWRFDFAWDGYLVGASFQTSPVNGSTDKVIRVSLEVQGGIWIQGGHNRGAGLKKEHEKRNEAAAMGWRILYVEPKHLCMMDTVNLIKRCLCL